MQLAFNFDENKSGSIVSNERIVEIQKFDVTFPEPENYFGIWDVDKAKKKWDHHLVRDNQMALFGEVGHYVKMSITNFWMFSMCPKLYAAHFLTKEEIGIPGHYSMEIGNVIDKATKLFLNYPIKDRNTQLLEDQLNQLEQNLKGLKDVQLSSIEIEDYLSAYVDFCNSFKTFEISIEVSSSERLRCKVGGILFTGKFDFLLKDLNDDKYILIDLKSMKYGGEAKKLEFFEILQVMYYTIALKKRNITVKAAGYYYFKERVLITDPIAPLDTFELKFKTYVDSLLKTSNFKPKKCFLCLICRLKDTCSVGKPLSESDFINPMT